MISNQETALLKILQSNKVLVSLLKEIRSLNLPNWYLGAGCVAQTVWNYKHGFDLNEGIKDYDLVYFDSDMGYESEDTYIRKAKNVLGDLPVEVRNQSRVHLWYESKFGFHIEPYISTEQAIDTWPTSATAIGVRLNDDDTYKIYAPYGLDDLLGLIIRPNKKLITEKIYTDKVSRWSKMWPKLRIEKW